jgi:hypothetical protein
MALGSDGGSESVRIDGCMSSPTITLLDSLMVADIWLCRPPPATTTNAQAPPLSAHDPKRPCRGLPLHPVQL